MVSRSPLRSGGAPAASYRLRDEWDSRSLRSLSDGSSDLSDDLDSSSSSSSAYGREYIHDIRPRISPRERPISTRRGHSQSYVAHINGQRSELDDFAPQTQRESSRRPMSAHAVKTAVRRRENPWLYSSWTDWRAQHQPNQTEVWDPYREDYVDTMEAPARRTEAWDRLYKDGQERARRQQLAKEREDRKIKKACFRPAIIGNPEEPRAPTEKFWDRLYGEDTDRRQQAERQRAEEKIDRQMNKEMYQLVTHCTFSPQICPYDQLAEDNRDVYTRLHHDGLQRQKNKKLPHNGPTFHPHTNPPPETMALSHHNVFHRLTHDYFKDKAEREHKEMSALQNQFRKTCTFRPKITPYDEMAEQSGNVFTRLHRDAHEREHNRQAAVAKWHKHHQHKPKVKKAKYRRPQRPSHVESESEVSCTDSSSVSDSSRDSFTDYSSDDNDHIPPRPDQFYDPCHAVMHEIETQTGCNPIPTQTDSHLVGHEPAREEWIRDPHPPVIPVQMPPTVIMHQPPPLAVPEEDPMDNRDWVLRELETTTDPDFVQRAWQRYANDADVVNAILGAIARMAATDPRARDRLAMLGAVPFVVGAMNNFRDHLSIQARGTLALLNLGRSPPISEQIAHAGGIDCVVSAMRHFAMNPDILQKGCAALWGLAETPHNKNRIGRVGGVEAIVDAMRAFSQDHAVQTHGMAALAMLAMDPENEHRITMCHGVEVVVGAMHMFIHSGDIKLLARAIGVLASLAMTDENKPCLMHSGAIDVIIEAMTSYPNDVALLGRSNGALCNISASRENAAVVAEKGGLQLVIDIMRNFPSNPDLLTSGIVLLNNLASLEQNSFAIRQFGGVDVIMHSMHNFQSDPILLTKGISALCTLAILPENKVYIAERGGIVLVLQAMRSYPQEPHLQIKGNAALWNFASEKKMRKSIAKQGGLDLIVASARNHRGNPELVTMARGAANAISPKKAKKAGLAWK